MAQLLLITALCALAPFASASQLLTEILADKTLVGPVRSQETPPTLLAGLILGAGPETSPPPAGLDANCTLRCAERAPGVCTAPAYVHVDCIGDGTTGAGGETRSGDANVRPFHDLGYVIDYGDSANPSGQGTWENSSSRAEKARDYSPIGAHVYETAGTFTVTTTVTNPLGQTSTTGTEDQITIQSEDAGWPAEVTKCVCYDGDDTGCRTSGAAGFAGCPLDRNGDGDCTDVAQGETHQAQCVESNDLDAQILPQAGRRTLFRGGDEFVLDANPRLADASNNGSLIGSYGKRKARVSVAWGGRDDLLWSYGGFGGGNFNGTSLSGWRIRDLRFQGSGFTPGHTVIKSSNIVTNKMLLLRVDKLGMGACWDVYREHTDPGAWSMLNAFFSVHCEVTVGDAGGGWMGWYGLVMKYGALVDYKVTWAASIGANLNGGKGGTTQAFQHRIMGIDHTFFAHNQLACLSIWSTCTTQLRSYDPASPGGAKPSVFNVWNDYTVYANSGKDAPGPPPGGNGSPGLAFNTESRHGESGGEELGNGNLIVDGFRYITGPAHTSCNYPKVLLVWPDTTIRNSSYVSMSSNCSAPQYFIQTSSTSCRGEEPHNVHVYNNTYLRGTKAVGDTGLWFMTTQDAANPVCASKGDAIADGARLRNNLIYDMVPAGGTDTAQGFECKNCVQSNNLHLSGAASCPFAGSDGNCSWTDLSGSGGLNCSETAFTRFDFRCLKLRANGGGAVNRGFAFPDVSAGNFSGYVYRDQWQGRRGPATGGPGAFDIGAHELGSTP